MAEYELLRDTMCTGTNEWLDVPEDTAALPDLQGLGQVYDLHQAIVRDSSGKLRSLVEQFTNDNDSASRCALMDQILFEWTGSANVDAQERGDTIDARKLSVLEKFFGQSFVGTSGANPTNSAANLLKRVIPETL